jgi:hypothetical protein
MNLKSVIKRLNRNLTRLGQHIERLIVPTGPSGNPVPLKIRKDEQRRF